MLDYDLTRNSASVTQVSNRLAGHVEIQTAFSRAHLDVNNAISMPAAVACIVSLQFCMVFTMAITNPTRRSQLEP